MMRTLFAATLLCVGFPGIVSAQVVNPTTIEFPKSADHDTVLNTEAVLSSYRVNVYTPTGTSPVSSADIGKPTPDANNLIRWANLPTLYATLPSGQYVAKIVAVGPGGSTESGASDPFSIAPRPPVPPGKPVIR